MLGFSWLLWQRKTSNSGSEDLNPQKLRISLLARDAVDNALAALRRFRALCDTMQVERVWAIATAACRDAASLADARTPEGRWANLQLAWTISMRGDARAAAETFTPRRRACSASESSSVKVVRVDMELDAIRWC